MIVQAADRAHTSAWDLLSKGTAWVELYRTALIAERKAAADLQAREARRARMARMKGGR